MKFGSLLEQESVREWSLHNVDYNSLKHEIKVHTTRDQAAAIAIPGHQDPAFQRFEEALYDELCSQHGRVDLFVSSKASEIARRLEHLHSSIGRLVTKCQDEQSGHMTARQQRRLAKYERELLRCQDDMQAMQRFIGAQVVAFRKILKKYKKWTGSVALGKRFRDNVLSNPKSFTRRHFENLQARHDEVLAIARAAAPMLSEPSSPETNETPDSPQTIRDNDQWRDFTPLPPPQARYWNEYDYGSENGEADEEYAIYIQPGADDFPVLDYVRTVLKRPFDKLSAWFSDRAAGERQPLLPNHTSNMGYSTVVPGTDTEEELTSSDEYPSTGYVTHYATLPSVDEQRARRYREHGLHLGTIGCFVASVILIGIASVLMTTGKRRFRLEVEAGVTMGIVTSLFSACCGLGLSLYRKDHLGLWYHVTLWSVFIACCVLNGMLLILVVDW